MSTERSERSPEGSETSAALQPNETPARRREAVIDRARCFGCGACTTVCKFGAISITARKAAVDSTKCTGCALCVDKCAVQVISMTDH
jgi:ferredoxin